MQSWCSARAGGAHLPQTFAEVTWGRSCSSPPAAGWTGAAGATQQNSAKPPRAGLKDGSARLGRQWGSRGCNSDTARGTAQLGMWLSPWAGALLGVRVKIRVTGLRKRKRGVLHPFFHEGN